MDTIDCFLCISLPDRELNSGVISECFNSPTQDVPEAVTYGFRQALYEQFSEIFKLPVNKTDTVKIIDYEVRVKSAVYIKVKPDLSVINVNDRLLTICIEAPRSFEQSIGKLAKGHTLGKNVLNALKDILPELGIDNAVNVKSSYFLGVNWFFDNKPEVRGHYFDKTIIFANYFFGWLSLQRAKRCHTTINLYPEDDKAKHLYGSEILKVRMALINIERLSLIDNRSKNAEIKRFCNDVIDDAEFSLRKRLDDAKSIHQSFEQHLENYSAIEQNINSAKTNKILLMLSAASISLSVFSVSFVGIDENNALVFNIGELAQPPVSIVLSLSAVIFSSIILANRRKKLNLKKRIKK